MNKYLDQPGLKKVIQTISAKLDLKLGGKLSSIVSADQNNIVVDSTDPMNPLVNLSSAILAKINAAQQAAGVFKLTDFKVITAATTLTVADCGSMVNMQGGTSFATKLPLSSAVVIGSRIEFLNTCTVNTSIIPQGSDTLVLGLGTGTSLTLLPGDTAVFELARGGKWVLSHGSAQLAYSGSFASSGGTNSYQRLPSGLLIQKGQITCPNNNTWYTFSFPTMFSNAGGVVVSITPVNATSYFFGITASHDVPTNTGVKVFTSQSNITLDVIAIGN